MSNSSCTTVEECKEWTVGKIVVYQLQEEPSINCLAVSKLIMYKFPVVICTLYQYIYTRE